MDSGASRHMTGEIKVFSSNHPYMRSKHRINLSDASFLFGAVLVLSNGNSMTVTLKSKM